IVGVYPASDDLLPFTLELFSQAWKWNLAGAALGIISLGLLFLFSRVKRLPGAIIVIALGIGIGKWLDLPHYGIGLVGPISFQLTMPTLPDLLHLKWLHMGELALALAMILYAESYGSIRNFAMKHGDTISPNRDLAALGAANLLSGLFHGMPVGAGYSATSANEAAGAVSRFAGVVAAATILVVVVTMLPAVALTPQPVLAAIVIHAVSGTLTPSVFRPYFKWRRDRLVVIASVLSVLVLGVLGGLLLSIGVSMVIMLRRFSESTISVLGRLGQGHDFVSIALHPEATPIPGILILRPDEPLFFANIERILNQALHHIGAAGASVHTIILSLEESPDLDGSSLEALRDFCEALVAEGKQVLFSRLKDAAQDVLKRVNILGVPPSSIRGLSVDDAVCQAQESQCIR
ncbi:MAG: SulP family inorganic anion transporter, partial [Burkholderiales bacterium]